jgi:hypothetical protein
MQSKPGGQQKKPEEKNFALEISPMQMKLKMIG